MRYLPRHIRELRLNELRILRHRDACALGNAPGWQVMLQFHQPRPATDMPKNGTVSRGHTDQLKSSVQPGESTAGSKKQVGGWRRLVQRNALDPGLQLPACPLLLKHQRAAGRAEHFGCNEAREPLQSGHGGGLKTKAVDRLRCCRRLQDQPAAVRQVDLNGALNLGGQCRDRSRQSVVALQQCRRHVRFGSARPHRQACGGSPKIGFG